MNIFERYKINLSEEKLEKFEKYFEILTEYNEKFNITAITEKNEVYLKHFVDSVLGYKYINGKNILDIGSGGGFPILPLKIVNEDLCVTMVEATGKKCEFLSKVVEKLELKNAKVINKRAEDLAFDKNFREKFDVCTARAVARLNILSEYCLPFVKIGGSFISFKGDYKEELEEAKTAIEILGGKIEKVDEYSLEEAKRSLIIVKKEKTTDIKYPRSNAQIRKKPL